MGKKEIFEKVLELYKHCRDIVNTCDLEIEEDWKTYRDAQEGMYMDLEDILEDFIDE